MRKNCLCKSFLVFGLDCQRKQLQTSASATRETQRSAYNREITRTGPTSYTMISLSAKTNVQTYIHDTGNEQCKPYKMFNFKAKTCVGFNVVKENLYICLHQKTVKGKDHTAYNVFSNYSDVLLALNKDIYMININIM